jgi:hypothetical protein
MAGEGGVVVKEARADTVGQCVVEIAPADLGGVESLVGLPFEISQAGLARAVGRIHFLA